MKYYSLQSNEVVLYKGTAHLIKQKAPSNEGYFTQMKKEMLDSFKNSFTNVTTELILTNCYLVLTTKTKQFLSSEQVESEKYPIGEIKIYNGVPQIKQSDSKIEIYLTSTELVLDLIEKKEANKFSNAVYELITGKSVSERNAEKIKKKVHLVDDALGINTVDTVKNVVENGVVGTVLGGLGKKSRSVSKIGETIIHSIKHNPIPQNTEVTYHEVSNEVVQQSKSNDKMTYDEQIDMLKKLKDLLDSGILTQEEFDSKKREILNL